MESPANFSRYRRQTVIAEFGPEGQARLKGSSVLCVGAGGLGSPVLVYLAAAGLGRIGIIDADVVDLTNLQRQVLYSQSEIGSPKAECAAKRLKSLNDEIVYEPYISHLDSTTADELIPRYDLVIDCTDNFASRFVLNDACWRFSKPLVSAGILGFDAYVSAFRLDISGPCFRCFMPEAPPPELVRSPAEIGVLGAAVGVIGSLEAMQVIKILAKMGSPLNGKMLYYKVLDETFRTAIIKADPSCKTCSKDRAADNRNDAHA